MKSLSTILAAALVAGNCTFAMAQGGGAEVEVEVVLAEVRVVAQPLAVQVAAQPLAVQVAAQPLAVQVAAQRARGTRATPVVK